MAGYTKLFGSILHSSVWSEDNETRIVWITMLAMADREGIVAAAIPGLARAANISLECTEKALKRFHAPDPYSRSPEFEGRRIETINGGWRLLNHTKYREKLSIEERREYNRIKQQEYRARLSTKVNDSQLPINDSQSQSAVCTHSRQQTTDTDSKSKEQKHLSPIGEERECTGQSNTSSDSTPAKSSSSETVVSASADTGTTSAGGSSSKIANGSAKASDGAVDSQRQFFQQQWNSLPSQFPKIREWPDKRKMAFKARITDPFFRDNWQTALKKLRDSPHCRGENDRGWVADVDFFLNANKFTKIMEDSYLGRTPVAPKKANPAAYVTDDYTEKLRRAEADFAASGAESQGFSVVHEESPGPLEAELPVSDDVPY